MNLDEYIAAIEACPVEEVSDRFRIRDNYRVYVKGDFDAITTDFEGFERWERNRNLFQAVPGPKGERSHRYDSVPPSAVLSVYSWLTPYFGDTDVSTYNLTLFFNTDIDSREPYSVRVFVDSVLHVLRYVNEKGIPLFVPSSKIIHPGNSS